MQGRIISNILLVVGVIGVVLFGLVLLFSVLMVLFPGTQPMRELFESAVALTALASPIGIAGGVVMFIGWRSLRRARKLETIRSLLLSNRRVEVTSVSTQIGLDVTRTRKLMLDAIGRGLVRGAFETENLFISDMDPSDIHMATAPCAGCGATAQSLVREAEALVCPFCGAVAATGPAVPHGGDGHQVVAAESGESSARQPTRDHYNAGSMDSITYTTTQKSSIVPLFFVGIGIVFLGAGLLFTVVLLFLVPPVALVTFGGSIFGLAFAAYGGWRWYSNSQRRLQLTPQALVSLTRGKPFHLQLADICGISVREGTYWAKDPLSQIDIPTQHRYWIVRIETNAGNYLDLDVTQDGYIGLFDVARVLRDLLRRLPAIVQIDPRIRNYLATGRMM